MDALSSRLWLYPRSANVSSNFLKTDNRSVTSSHQQRENCPRCGSRPRDISGPNDTLCPPPGTKSPFRMCDACAYGLSRLEGTPRCELFWPEKNRDRAVAACAAFLRQYGHRLRLDEKIVDGDGLPLRPGYWDHSRPRFT